ncbi:MAG: hypothetical protein ABI134_09205 [Byssovorax sp.]
MTIAPDAAPPSPVPFFKARVAGRPIAYGLAVGSLTSVAYLAACVARGAGGVAVPIASLTALLLVAATPLLRRLARWAGTPRPELCAAWSLLGAFPLLALGARIALSDPVLSSTWRCGTGDMGLLALSPIPFTLLGALSGLIAFGVSSSRRQRREGSRLHLLSRGALVLGTILVAAAASRALHKPSTDHAIQYLKSLPTIAVLPPPPPVQAGATDPAPDPDAPVREVVDEVRFGDIIARRGCKNEMCSAILLRADGPAPPSRSMKLQPVSSQVPPQEPVRIQQDEEHGLWIVGDNRAFRAGDLVITDIRVDTIGDELSAPLGWILGGAAGLLLAAALEYRRHRLAQRLLQIEAARAGVLGENGWITFDDDARTLRASPDLALSPGPVLLVRRGAGAAVTGGYRSEGTLGEDEIVAGAREDLAAPLRARMAALSALGIASALLTTAPLLASWTAGLVFGWR